MSYSVWSAYSNTPIVMETPLTPNRLVSDDLPEIESQREEQMKDEAKNELP
jgi:hypothetical protein